MILEPRFEKGRFGRFIHRHIFRSMILLLYPWVHLYEKKEVIYDSGWDVPEWNSFIDFTKSSQQQKINKS